MLCWTSHVGRRTIPKPMQVKCPTEKRKIEWETFSNRLVVGVVGGVRYECVRSKYNNTSDVFWQMCTECGINRFSSITNAFVDPDKTFGPQMLWLSMDFAFCRETSLRSSSRVQITRKVLSWIFVYVFPQISNILEGIATNRKDKRECLSY